MEISAILSKLAMHYWRPDFTPSQMRQLMADYLEDLRGYSPEAIARACAKYRRDPKNSFFPRSGQLLEILARPDIRFVMSPKVQAEERENLRKLGII